MSAIEINSLSFAYSGGEAALRDISFAVESGETVGLVGPSGAGKSTLLMHLNGLLPERISKQHVAKVSVCGLEVTKENLKKVRQLVGFVFQDPDDQLFCPTVREDVAFGPLNLGLPKSEVLEIVATSLAQVGLTDYENRGTLQLSVGERKRVCLAGVLACSPEVLALDEPFSNLDPRARRMLVGILSEFKGSQLIATHDLELVVELCQRVVVLDEGQVKAIGPVEEVLADAPLMALHGLEVPYQLRQS
jgi:energy-coupling factor transporter ATP-binding protein EcfA2